MAINNNPPRDRMSPRSTIWGRVKGNHMGETCPSAPSVIFITMARVLRNVTNVTRGAIGKFPGGMVVLNVELQGISREIVQSLRIMMGEMGMHKAGCMQLETQRRMEMHRGTRTPMSSRAQEYMAKGCQVFLAQISAKKEEDKSEGKQLKDVPIVQDFLEVFPEDLPGLPLARPVEFKIDLIPGAALVARAPY
ncbi:hypothetical protein Tco_1480979 [Tanacetum coccineum]